MTTSKNNNIKPGASETEVVDAEASVPQQQGANKVTVLKDATGKDQVIISGEKEKATIASRFKGLIRNKKVLAGLGTVAALVVVAIIKSAMSGGETELEYTIVDAVEPEGDTEPADITD